jgi:hypothetical protein
MNQFIAWIVSSKAPKLEILVEYIMEGYHKVSLEKEANTREEKFTSETMKNIYTSSSGSETRPIKEKEEESTIF